MLVSLFISINIHCATGKEPTDMSVLFSLKEKTVRLLRINQSLQSLCWEIKNHLQNFVALFNLTAVIKCYSKINKLILNVKY